MVRQAHYGVERTTIILEKPVLKRVRDKAKKEGKTLKDTLREIILEGLNRPQRKKETLPELPSFHMGRALVDVSNRERLYEIWDKEEAEEKARRGS